MLQLLAQHRQLSLRDLKRLMESYLLQRDPTSVTIGIVKPSGMHVRDMFRPDMFCSGSNPLPPHRVRLHPLRMDHYHKLSCASCRAAHTILPSCYYSSLRRCITHGWLPTIIPPISPAYHSRGNSPLLQSYAASVSAEFSTMLSHSVVAPAPPWRPGDPVRYVSPMSLVIKNSDMYRAKELARVLITDQASLDRANRRLLALHLKPVKVRLVTNTTQPGVNAAALTPPFRYPSLMEAIKILVRNGYMAKVDFTRHYNAFGFAEEVSRFFCFLWFGRMMWFMMVFFGFSAAPYYISTFSSEIQAWLIALGIASCHMMDDFLITAPTKATCDADLATLLLLCHDVGLVIQESKTEQGQEITFLGFLISTIRMTIRMEKVQCRAMLLELVSCLHDVEFNRRLPTSTIAHICGKLNWYAEVVQTGRVMLRCWWDYLRLPHHQLPSPSLRQRLLTDSAWWSAMLTTWGNDAVAGNEYPILSMDELLTQPHLLQVVQSDASGIDGFGFFYGAVDEVDPRYVCRSFPPEQSRHSSHALELFALASFLEQDATSHCLLVWLTDSTSCVWSVNKGRCHAEEDLVIVRRILMAADSKHIQLLSLWVPRESNQLADYLSHFSSLINREEVRGRLSSLAQTAQLGGRNGGRTATSTADLTDGGVLSGVVPVRRSS